MEPTVQAQILAIRDTGETSMFDVNTVAAIAVREGFRDLAEYLPDHKEAYGHFILTGEAPEEPDEARKTKEA